MAECDGSGAVFAGLFEELFGLSMPRKGGDAVGGSEMFYHLKRATADGTGCAKNRDAFVQSNPLSLSILLIPVALLQVLEYLSIGHFRNRAHSVQ